MSETDRRGVVRESEYGCKTQTQTICKQDIDRHGIVRARMQEADTDTRYKKQVWVGQQVLLEDTASRT